LIFYTSTEISTCDKSLIGIIVVITSFDKHYYEENEIEVGKPMNCQVAVNHIVELTAEEKAEARQKAIQKYQEEEVRKLQNRNRPAAKKETIVQPSLFDF
ncbi:PcfK-like family protein, partial [Paraprevotella clara]|uniref:PcfK-like family protein n=1 Tax=Paraprevotella clara TaxID=454154 RepID=UPI003A90FF98